MEREKSDNEDVPIGTFHWEAYHHREGEEYQILTQVVEVTMVGYKSPKSKKPKEKPMPKPKSPVRDESGGHKSGGKEGPMKSSLKGTPAPPPSDLPPSTSMGSIGYWVGGRN